MLYEVVFMSFSSMFCFFKKSVSVFDLREFSSCAAFDVVPSVTMDTSMTAMSGFVMTLPSPEKETVLVVAAVLSFWLILTKKYRDIMTTNASTAQKSHR